MSNLYLSLDEKAAARRKRAGPRSCYGCKYLHRETESWEMPWIAWWECGVKWTRSQLTSFPYLNTKCPDFEAKDSK